MNVSRYLKTAQIKLDLDCGSLEGIDPEKDIEKERQRLKDEVIEELTGLFDISGEIRNLSKFSKDFINREKIHSTGIGEGIALPHVRSLQPRKTVLIFARSQDGVWYDAIDKKPVQLFFGITAPEYDDKEFYKFHKWISNAFVIEDWLKDALLWAEDEHEIIKILSHLH